jgi:hypothetical protein
MKLLELNKAGCSKYSLNPAENQKMLKDKATKKILQKQFQMTEYP